MEAAAAESHQSSSNSTEHILSTTDGETVFFRSIIRYRPRGYNRHFSMLGICKDLEKELQVVIPSHQIWDTLRSCYNLDLLAEMEPDDPDEIDRSKSTIELLNSKQAFFQEFQLPIHPTAPPEISFLKLVNERRLETSSHLSSSDEQANVPSTQSPRSKRTTVNSSSKLHLDQHSITANKHQNKHQPGDSSYTKAANEHRLSEEGMDSDLTEQEDYEDDDDDDDDDDNQKDKYEEDEEEESTPEPKLKKMKTSKYQAELNSTTAKTQSNRSRNNNNPTNFSSNNSNSKQSSVNANSLARSNRSSNRTRWKK